MFVMESGEVSFSLVHVRYSHNFVLRVKLPYLLLVTLKFKRRNFHVLARLSASLHSFPVQFTLMRYGLEYLNQFAKILLVAKVFNCYVARSPSLT